MTSTLPPTTPLSAIKVQVLPVPTSSTPVLPTKTTTNLINGQHTTVITQSFADRIFITVTQLNKFGCLYQAVTSSNPAAFDSDPADQAESNSPLPPPLPTTSVTKLVGTEPSPAYTALYQLYVAQIASIVKHGAAGGDARPLIVSLALKPMDKVKKSEERDYDDSDDESDSLLLTSEDEQKRFMAIMELVQKCKIW